MLIKISLVDDIAQKILRQKEKLLVISSFFFCFNVFPSHFYKGRQNQVLFGKGLIETACHSYRAPYNFSYNNIFCYLCNEQERVHPECFDTGRQFAAVSFAAVLDFNQVIEDETNILSECPENHVLDKYLGICRQVSCIFPRFLQDGKCVNRANNLTEVAYRLQLKFTPSAQVDANELPNAVNVIESYAQALLTNWGVLDATADSELYYTLSVVMVEPEILLEPNPDNGNEIQSTASPLGDSTTDFNDQNTSPIPKQKFVDIPLQQFSTLVNYIVWQVRWYFRYQFVDPVPSDFIDKVLGMNYIDISLNGSFTWETYDFSMSIANFESDGHGNLFDPDRRTMLIRYPSTMYIPRAYLLTPIYAEVQTINPTMTCPLVRIDHDEYDITKTPDGLYVEEFNVTFVRSHIKKEGSMSNSSVYICSDSYFAVTDKYTLPDTHVHRKESNVSIQGVLSIVCSCISILCSILTLTTYCVFDDYRTQPGINNMCLCVYLICAQALFTFATPQAKIVSEVVCSILGALAHFFWLMVVFAMNVCCFHMVTVFRGQPENRTKTAPNGNRTLFYNIYCILASLVFVVINIVVSVVDKDAIGIGYKSHICYISKSAMIGYTFAIPLGLILCVNVLSFVFVVLRISGASNVSISSNKNRSLFKIYAKLSSLTGLTWILGFLYVFTKMEFFEYCFIILNGGIGFFIFLSFVCNRRTYEKYKSTFCKLVAEEKNIPSASAGTKDTVLNSDPETREKAI